MEDNPGMWPQIIEEILFANIVIPYFTTQCSPFMLMYNREQVLPIDVKHNLDKDGSKEPEKIEGDGDEEQPVDLNFFDPIFSSATKVQTIIADNAAHNVKATQKKTKTRL